MVFTMHTTRYLLLLHKDNPTKQAQVVSEFAMRQRNLRGLETIYGIQRTTVVTATGEVVRSAPADLTGVTTAGERRSLNLENSAPLRELLTKGTQVPSAPTKKGKVKPKPRTTVELMGGRLGTQEAESHVAHVPRPSDYGMTDLGYDPQQDLDTLRRGSTKLRRPDTDVGDTTILPARLKHCYLPWPSEPGQPSSPTSEATQLSHNTSDNGRTADAGSGEGKEDVPHRGSSRTSNHSQGSAHRGVNQRGASTTKSRRGRDRERCSNSSSSNSSSSGSSSNRWM